MLGITIETIDENAFIQTSKNILNLHIIQHSAIEPSKSSLSHFLETYFKEIPT